MKSVVRLRWGSLWVLGAGLAGCAANATPTSGGPAGSGQGGSGMGVGATGGAGTGGINTAGTSGSGGFSGEACAAVSQQAENRLQPADIIWAVDTSGSMTFETAAVQANLNAFSQQIVASGIDVHIVLIVEYPIPFCPPGFPCGGICIEPPLGVGQCPTFDTNPDAGYWHLNQNVSSGNSLSVILSTYQDWQPMLRKNATKSFVVISDDNQSVAPVTSANDFVAEVAKLDPVMFADWRFHGIFSFTDCPDVARPGTVYADLTAMTGGVAGDLCLQNFQPVFDQLATGVIEAAKLDCEWEIPPPPDGSVFSSGEVNVRYTSGVGATSDPLYVEEAARCGPDGGWYYDDVQNPTRVVACPTTCDEIRLDPSGKIDILFGCATIAHPK